MCFVPLQGFPVSRFLVMEKTFSGLSAFTNTKNGIKCSNNANYTSKDFGTSRGVGSSRILSAAGSVTSTNFRSVTGWTNSASGDENYDYGAIIIPTNLGNTVGWFGFGVYSDADIVALAGRSELGWQ